MAISPVNTRSFSAENYGVTVSYSSMSLPWFSDYMHLVFWFFFLTTIIISVWIVQTFFMVVRGGESRKPVRETRGFSRAQTGDSLTAIIPMCWSITMLMHASTHSSNFDENTDSTSMTFTVIAYQWGWNYLFPHDTVRRLRGEQSSYALPSSPSEELDASATELFTDLSSRLAAAYTSRQQLNLAVSSPSNPLGSASSSLKPTTLPIPSVYTKPASHLTASSVMELRPRRSLSLINAMSPVGSNNVIGKLKSRPSHISLYRAPESNTSRSISTVADTPATVVGQPTPYSEATLRPGPFASLGTNFNLHHLSELEATSLKLREHGALLLSAIESSNCCAPSALTDEGALSLIVPNKSNSGAGVRSIGLVEPSHCDSRLREFAFLIHSAPAPDSVMGLKLPNLYDDIDVEFNSYRSELEISSTRQTDRSDLEVSAVGGLVSRMRITAGAVLPSDIPIHLICGSKDVIHSWAVPSLSIKVDCIPGYNCHRRLLIRWRGLFWGQCMEVCGRYHHWMPLLLKVSHVDSFIMWLNTLSN